MNKRIKVLVSAVLAAVMLVLCIPFTAAAAGTTVSVTIQNYKTANGWTNGVEYNTLVMDDVITVTADGTDANTGKYYDSGFEWRMYQTGTPSIVVSASAGTIETVKITYNVKNTGVLTFNGSNVSSGTAVTVNAASATFSVGNTGSATNGQVKITKIEVVYTAAAGAVCEHTYTDCDDTTCDKGCGHTRTAVAHKYDGCEDTACNTCNKARTALEHKYTNEYDAKCDNTGCTNTRTVTLPSANSTLDLVTASKIGAAQDHNTYTANKYYVTGTVKTVGSDKYGNITIEDEDGNTFYLYTVKDNDGNLYEDVTENKPVVGAEATFYGPLGRYNSTTQMNPAVIYVKVTNCEHEYTNELDATCDKCGEPRTVTLPAADSTLDFATITKLGLAQGHNNYTSAKYYFVGTIKEVSNTQFGNMTVEDEDGNVFTVYGSYDATGDKSYSEMTDPFVAGDKVKVYGIVGQYNGTAQIKNGWLSAYTAGSGTQGGGNQGAGSPNTNDSVVAYIAVAVVALFGIAYVSKKKH